MIRASALLLALAAAASARADGGRAAPDAVLISIDDLRADRVTPELMPNLWALRREGVWFEQAYSQASWTLPSHASLFFSQYPWSHGAGGFNANHPRAAAPGSLSLAQALKSRGYAAASFANCPFFNDAFGLGGGFSPLEVRDRAEDPLPEGFDWLLSTGPRAGPRFLFAHTYAVHNYLDVEDLDAELAAPPACPLRVRSHAYQPGRKQRPEATCAQTVRAYDRAAMCLDRELGALFARLKAAGRWDDTLLAIVADHGEGLCEGPEGDRVGHNDLGYEEQLRVPWLLKLPARGRGRVVREPVRLIDVAPTMLAALGLPPEAAFEGRDVAGAAGVPAAGPVFADTDRGLAVREGDWKLLRGWTGQLELYDLSTDTAELKNLAAARADRVSALDALLREHAGSQRAGWRLATRGRSGTRFRLELSSDRPLTMVIPIFVEPQDPPVRVSGDRRGVTAEFVAQRDGDEDWLVVEASSPGARVTLRAFENGAPMEPASVRFGLGAAPGPQPWRLSSLRAAAEASSVPPARDGLTVWRAAGSRTPLPVSPDERTRRALQAAGYLP